MSLLVGYKRVAYWSGRTPSALAALLSALAWVWLLSGCSPQPPAFKGTDITGSALTADFSLQGLDGNPVKSADFLGKVMVVFFGFTQCPDVCPSTMQNLAQTMEILGADQDKVAVVFVTLDPARDTPALLTEYVPQFNKRFVALTGTDDQIAAAAKGLRVFYQKVDGKTPTSYTFDHTASAYVIDKKGVLRLLVRHGAPAADVASDLKTLLAQK
jgi:protein SCO1/2